MIMVFTFVFSNVENFFIEHFTISDAINSWF
ncbi:hypothetical protein BH11BAC3_BH11BAC3_29470 [soil metagenome]